MIRRWLKFNAVGAIGIVVQLGALAILNGVLRVQYLPATALAVEIAVLHNFVWHERWTWRGRTGTTGVWTRLLRFNLTTGALSILSNLVLMRLFVGQLHLQPLVANMLSIAVTSVANFLVSELFVFRGAVGRAGCIVVFVLAAGVSAQSLRVAKPKEPQASPVRKSEPRLRIAGDPLNIFQNLVGSSNTKRRAALDQLGWKEEERFADDPKAIGDARFYRVNLNGDDEMEAIMLVNIGLGGDTRLLAKRSRTDLGAAQPYRLRS